MNRRLAHLLVLLLTPPAAIAAPVDYVSEVKPLLAQHCVKCHGPEKQKGKLRLDDRAWLLRGGESGGPSILPGDAGKSRLVKLVTSADPDERMPPKGDPLDAQQIELLTRWIDEGAPWPEAEQPEPAIAEMVITDTDREHWAFLPLRSVVVPESDDPAWVRTPVDAFVRRAQELQGLTPSPQADARTLVRRLYFDFIGLPPTPDEMQRWTAAIVESRDAVGALVDELLGDPHYGERWARHWLDVARYADSNGMEGDADRPTAYHFRDFVISALNDDLPFDTFVRWQLAGDEIEPGNPRAIAATGFLTAGHSTKLDVPMEEEKLRYRANELDDIVSTTGQGLLALTLACARCHDHKYDPIPSRDYYRLMRIFNSGDRTEVPLASPAEIEARRLETARWQEESDAAEKRREAWLEKAKPQLEARVRAAKIASLDASDADKRLLLEQADDPRAKQLAGRFKKELKAGTGDYIAALTKAQKREWDELSAAVEDIRKRKPAALPTAFAFADFAPEPRESWFFERGDFMARNERMDLGFLSVMTGDKGADDYWRAAKATQLRGDSTQQRRALADWMTDLEDGAGALLARVMVNRVWQHHFGDGLVRTPGDFGTRGELPTHPELLEWLTGEFIRSGWSLKHLHRLIANSASYQQSSAFDEANAAVDPENRLLWRRRPLRLESEILRDAMLSVAGTLNPAMFGPGFKPPIPAEALQARNVKDPYPKGVRDTPETRRRTVYMFHKRVVQYPLMQAFDAPDAQTSCARRTNTMVAPQALALLNDPFVRLRSEELAKRLQAGADGADARVRLAFQLCLHRDPAPEELGSAVAFIDAQTAAREKPAEVAQLLALTDFCQALFGLNEFIYID